MTEAIELPVTWSKHVTWFRQCINTTRRTHNFTTDKTQRKAYMSRARTDEVQTGVRITNMSWNHQCPFLSFFTPLFFYGAVSLSTLTAVASARTTDPWSRRRLQRVGVAEINDPVDQSVRSNSFDFPLPATGPGSHNGTFFPMKLMRVCMAEAFMDGLIGPVLPVVCCIASLPDCSFKPS